MNIYEAIGSVVSATNVALTDYDITLNYLYGSAKEIQQTLVRWSKTPDIKANKYPCLLLFTPIAKPVDEDLLPNITTIPVSLVLVKDTEKTYTTPERINYVYKPYLWLIERIFIEQLKLSRYFNTINGLVPHTSTDIFFYSPTPAHEQNVFSAVLDAIEFTNMELSLIDYPCEQETYDITYNVIHDGDNVVHDGENVVQTVTYYAG